MGFSAHRPESRRSPVPEGMPRAPAGRAGFLRTLAGMSFEEQVAAVRPAPNLEDAAVQAKADPSVGAAVQMTADPQVVVPNTSHIKTGPVEQAGDSWRWMLLAEVAGQTYEWGMQVLEVESDVAVGFSMHIDPHAALNTRDYTMVDLDLPGYSWTLAALEAGIAVFESLYNCPPVKLVGELDKDNLTNFQKEYVASRITLGDNATREQIAIDAVQRVSFGRWRVAIQYSVFTVTKLDSFETVTIDGREEHDVPTVVAFEATLPIYVNGAIQS